MIGHWGLVVKGSRNEIHGSVDRRAEKVLVCLRPLEWTGSDD